MCKCNTRKLQMASFNLTDEQEKVVEASKNGKNMKIVAFAGAGKTATLIEVAKALSDKTVLYLAFNKVIVKEASMKMPSNVACRTFHSLAYTNVPSWVRNRATTGDLMPYFDMIKLTGANHFNETLRIYVTDIDSTKRKRLRFDENLQKHYYNYTLSPKDGLAIIKKGMEFFYQSLDPRPTAEHAVRALEDRIGREFKYTPSASHWATLVLKGMNILWDRNNMPDIKDRIDNGHSFYLKYWQLSAPILSQYDVILFDEAQDADPLMLDILGRQTSSQVIYVGDPHQQIYGWRGAKNAMATVEADAYYLTKSFRFGKEIAGAADTVLKFLGEKNTIGGAREKDAVWSSEEDSSIKMLGDIKSVDAILVRSNAGVLNHAIELTERGQRFILEVDIKHIIDKIKNIELILEKGYETPERGKIIEEYKEKQKALKKDAGMDTIKLDLEPAKTPVIKNDVFYLSNGIHDLADLELYVLENPACNEVTVFYNWVERYGADRLYNILNSSEKNKKGVKISTIHKAKGAEWDNVLLGTDVVSRLLVPIKEGEDIVGYEMVYNPEEYRILYVALTRAKQNLYLPDRICIALEEMEMSSLEELSNSRFGF